MKTGVTLIGIWWVCAAALVCLTFRWKLWIPYLIGGALAPEMVFI